MRRRPCLVACVVTAAVTAAACAQSVSGFAEKARPVVPDPDRNYGYLDDRCGLLDDGSIQEMFRADNIVRPYSGAVCQYVMARGQEMIDVTFSWFERGSLDRERALATGRGAQVTDTVLERHPGFVARRGAVGTGCAATAAAGSGVLSWWVQFRGETGGDPCADAEKLLSRTLASDL